MRKKLPSSERQKLMRKINEHVRFAYPEETKRKQWLKKYGNSLKQRNEAILREILPGNFIFHCYSWARQGATLEDNIIRIFETSIKTTLASPRVSVREQLEAHMVTARAADLMVDLYIPYSENPGIHNFVHGIIARELPKNPEMRKALKYLVATAIRILKNKNLI